MRSLHYVIIASLSTLLLSGCNTIEHRSEKTVKSPLPIITHPNIQPKLIWSNSKSSGVGKSDAKLRLEVTESDVFVADYMGKVLDFNRESGRLKSEIATKTQILAGPVVANNKVLVGTADARIMSYQFPKGQLLWQAEAGGTILSAPQVQDGVAFVHVLDGSVIALNMEDGRQLWCYRVSIPPLVLRQSSRPVIVGNLVVVGFANGKLVALNRLDGTPEWEKEIAVSKGRSDIQRMVDISADPVIQGNQVYAVSYQGKIATFDLETGELIWERELSSYSGIALTEQAVFVPDSQGALWAFNRKNGEVIWKQTGLTGRRLSPPVVLGNSVIVGDEEGYLHWVTLKDGSFEGRVLVDSKGIETAPIVKEGVLYVLGRSGKVVAYGTSRRNKEGN